MASYAPRPASRRAFLRVAVSGAGALGLGALLGACGAPQAPSDPLALPTLDPSQPTLQPVGGTPEPQAAEVSVPTRPPATSADAGKTTIVLGHWDGLLRPALADFERENPGVQVRFIPAYIEEYHRGLRSALVEGKGAPDVAAVTLSWLGIFAERGGLVDLSSPPFDGASLAKDMVPGAWASGAVDGKQIGVPFSISPAGQWYRADLLADAGVADDPQELRERVQSWEDMLALAQELKQKKAERSLFFDARDLFYAAVGQEEFGWLDGNKVLIEEKGTRGAQIAAQTRELKLDADLVSSGGFNLAMKNNQLAGFFAGADPLPYLVETFPDTAGQWRLLPAPGGPAVFGASFLTVPEQSEQQELAWALVKYLTARPKTQNAYLQASGVTPAYMPAWAEPLYDAPVDFFGGQPVYRLWADMARDMRPARLSQHHLDATGLVETELSQIVERGKDPEQAMRDAEAAMLRKAEGLVA
jgi:multiple sugar transport system substrate-binding protein